MHAYEPKQRRGEGITYIQYLPPFLPSSPWLARLRFTILFFSFFFLIGFFRFTIEYILLFCMTRDWNSSLGGRGGINSFLTRGGDGMDVLRR